MSSRIKLEPVHMFSAAEEEDNLNEADYWDEHWWWPLHLEAFVDIFFEFDNSEANPNKR